MVDIAEEEVAGAVAKGEALDEAGAARESDEQVGLALRLAVDREGAADGVEGGGALEGGEVGIAFHGRRDAEGGETAQGGEGLVGSVGEGLRGSEVVQVTRGIGAQGEGRGIGVAGGGEVFALVGGLGRAAEGGVRG